MKSISLTGEQVSRLNITIGTVVNEVESAQAVFTAICFMFEKQGISREQMIYNIKTAVAIPVSSVEN